MRHNLRKYLNSMEKNKLNRKAKKRIGTFSLTVVLMLGNFANYPVEIYAEGTNAVGVGTGDWTEEDYSFFMNGSGGDITEVGTIDYSGSITKLSSEAFNLSGDNNWQMSEDGIDFIISKEGIVYDPTDSSYAIAYDDKQPDVILKEDTPIKGTLTIGYGHTGSVDGKPIEWNTRIKVTKARTILANDVAYFGGCVNSFANKNKLKFSQNQFDALTSFTYNVGGGVWTRSSAWTLRTMLLNGIGQYSNDEVINAFSLWNTSGGAILTGLTRRRRQEAAMFLGNSSLSAYKTGTYKVAKESLPVRKGPGTSYDRVKKDGKNYSLSKDTEVLITEIGKTYWGKFEEGWIQLDYCRYVIDGNTPVDPVEPDEPVAPEENYSTGFYVTDVDLNVRKGPGTEYAVVTAYKKGTKVKATETVGKWGKISDGWISLKYCVKYELSKTTVTATNKAAGIKLTWKEVKDADGYYIYKLKGDKWSKLKTINGAKVLTYTDENAIEGTDCQYKVVGFAKFSEGTITSDDSSVAQQYRLSRVSFKAISSPAQGQAKLSWKKKSKANGYELLYANNSGFDNSQTIKIAKVSTGTKTVKKLASKKKYYFKIRSYKVVGNKTYYSTWSKVKNIKVK